MAAPAPPSLGREPWGSLPDGRPVEHFVLDDGHGMRVGFSAFGGIITHIMQPDRAGAAANVALGFPDLAGYARQGAGRPYFGALVGRYANRIAGGAFTLDGVTHHLSTNDGPHTLHGGAEGFDRMLWEVAPATEAANAAGAVLTHTSPAGAQGFPGTLAVAVRYTLAGSVTDAGSTEHELRIDYRAETDAPTIVNLTNHSYFNLAGEGSGSVDAQAIRIGADSYLPVGPGLIPLGDPAPVDGTAFDLRHSTAIGAAMRAGAAGLLLARGFDHNWVLRAPASPGGLRHAATAFDAGSGRWLECQTTEPGLQFYTANFLDGTLSGTSGRAYRQGDGFTLETQHFPDSPNRPAYPSCVLRPGEIYRSRTHFRFGCSERFPGG